MRQNQLGENITRYRKAKGLSQEKVAEYMEVSRQAVTKWESNISKPSSDNLIKLAKLFDVSVEVLLGYKETDDKSDDENVTTSMAAWVFIVFSILCIVAYIVISSFLDIFHFGTLICMFVICFPVQLFLHIYFSNAVKTNSFAGIAGFDEKIEYHSVEVKKLLVQIDLHVGMLSSVYVFLFCTINCADLNIEWMNGLLIMVYVLNTILTILMNNYRSIDKIYCNEADKTRAIKSIPIMVTYIVLLFLGLGIIIFLFEVKGIENNTAPAMKLSGLLLLGVLMATIGFFVENNNINKWNPDKAQYRMKRISVGCLLGCIIVYGIMCVV